MFSNLGIVKNIISETEINILTIVKREEVKVYASKEFVSSINASLKSDEEETMIVEYDVDTKVINENITE